MPVKWFEDFERAYEKKYGKEAIIDHVPNPRVEREEHYYNPVSLKLRALGYRPSGELKKDLGKILDDLQPMKEKITSLRDVITPRTFWQKSSGI